MKAVASATDVDDAAREARQRVEELAKTQNVALERLDIRDRGARPSQPERRVVAPLAVGDYVVVETLGDRVGQLIETRENDAIVAVGTLKVTIPLKRLRKTNQAPPQAAISIRGEVTEQYVPSEIDLRGMRVDEIDDVVMHAVDNAVRADLRALRIIHGKGTGALRDRVGEMLRKEPRVTTFRLGAWNEGGAGVTVVELS